MAIIVDLTVAQMQSVLTSLGIAAANGNKLVYTLDGADPTRVAALMVLNAATSDHIFTPRLTAFGDMALESSLLAAYAAAIKVQSLT